MGVFDTIISFEDNCNRRISKEEIHRVTDCAIGARYTEVLFSAIQAQRTLEGELYFAEDFVCWLREGMKDIKECLAFIDAFRHHTVRYKSMKGEQESFMSDWRKVTEELLFKYLNDLKNFCSADHAINTGTAYTTIRDEIQRLPPTNTIELDEADLIADKDLDELINIVNIIVDEIQKLNNKMNRQMDRTISGIIDSLPPDFPHGRKESRAIYEAMCLCGLISGDLMRSHNRKENNEERRGDTDPKGDYIRQFFARRNTADI